MNEKKLKHLEFIQVVINRLGNNSFLVKSWCVTIVAALTALSSGTKDQYIIIAYFPVFVFWLLDSYSLWQERLFRELYDEVRVMEESSINFSMKFSLDATNKHKYLSAALSRTILPFYAVLVGTIIILMLVL
jgi:uncharacterized membrane protein